MLLDFLDQKNSIGKKIMGEDRIDPGTFSFMEPGWWAFHAAAIAGIYMLGSRISQRGDRLH